jgi:hypothetical protein
MSGFNCNHVVSFFVKGILVLPYIFIFLIYSPSFVIAESETVKSIKRDKDKAIHSYVLEGIEVSKEIFQLNNEGIFKKIDQIGIIPDGLVKVTLDHGQYKIWEYKNGKKNGVYRFYKKVRYENAEPFLYEEGQYENDLATGVYKQFWPNGKLKTLRVLEKGKWKKDESYYKNGNLKRRALFSKPHIIESEEKFYETGVLYYYRNNITLEEKNFDEKGNLQTYFKLFPDLTLHYRITPERRGPKVFREEFNDKGQLTKIQFHNDKIYEGDELLSYLKSDPFNLIHFYPGISFRALRKLLSSHGKQKGIDAVRNIKKEEKRLKKIRKKSKKDIATPMEKGGFGFGFSDWFLNEPARVHFRFRENLLHSINFSAWSDIEKRNKSYQKIKKLFTAYYGKPENESKYSSSWNINSALFRLEKYGDAGDHSWQVAFLKKSNRN